MANRFPLIVDPTQEKIEELPSGDNLNLTGSGISAVQNILPETTETYDLGSTTFKWRDLYLSGNSIFIGNGSISLANGIFTFTDENDQVITLSTDSTQFTNVTANTITADSFIGDGSQVSDVDAITLEGESKTYFENFANTVADTFANAAYANAISYVDTELGNLVNSAPGVLDTLNELAEAIGDDDNFFITVNNNINTAYSNAVAHADNVANDAFTNAVSEATSLANDAYSNAVSHADNVAANAFSNAVSYVNEQTSDTIEEGNNNLYFTEDRVRGSLSGTGDLEYDANTGEFSVTTYKSSDFDVDFTSKDTNDLNEGNNNLYFTDQRAIDATQSAINSAAGDAFTNAVNEAISLSNAAYSNAVSHADNVAGNAYSNAISYTDAEIANLVNTAPTVLDTLNELAAAINDDPDFANSVANQIATAYTNAVSQANTLASDAFSNAVAYVDSQTTDTIEEGSNNLYHTDERVRDAISVSGDLTYDSNTGILSITTYKSTDFDTDFSGKTTDDLSEGNTNLYWIEAPNDGEQYVRQNESWVTVDIPEGYDSNNFTADFATQTTDDLSEGNTNLYFTENRAVEAIENNTVNTVSVESSFILPVGNTSVRPANAVVGMMRFNTDLNQFEGYDGNQWVQFEAAFGFEGDMSTLSGTEDLESGSGTEDLNES